MIVFQQVLWMFLNIRLLGEEPRPPTGDEPLSHYAASLQLQYSRLCAVLEPRHRQEAVEAAHKLIAWLGLIEATEPLPSGLLSLLQRHMQRR